MLGLASLAGAGLSIAQNYDAAMGPLARANYKMSGKELARQYDFQKSYDKWKSALDYTYAQQYAENSAKWNVQGLKNANLNPILAATDGNFRGTFGTPSSGGASSSSARGSQSHDAAAAAAMSSAAKQNSLLDAQIRQVDAQTAQVLQKSENDRETGGLTGMWGALHSLATKAGLIRSKQNEHSALSRDENGRLIVNVEKAADLPPNSARSLDGSSHSPSRRGHPWRKYDVQYDKTHQTNFDARLRDLSQWLRSGGFFGNKSTRMDVVRRDSRKFSDVYW